MRKSALFLLGLVVTALVALGLVVLLSASQPFSRRVLDDRKGRIVQQLQNDLRHCRLQLQRATPEEAESREAEINELERKISTLKSMPSSPFFFWKKQVVYCLVGVVIAVIVARFDYHLWRDWNLAKVLFIVELALLLACLCFPPVKGSRRWIPLGIVDLQPSEFAKMVVVIVVSVWMDKAGWRVELFRRGALIPGLLIVALVVPILVEPDLGSSAVVLIAGGVVMFLAGTRWRYLFSAIPIGLLAFALVVFALPNRRERLASQYECLRFLSTKPKIEQVASDSSAAAKVDSQPYQKTQSRKAIQNGGIWGVGLYNSMQKELYLPENHTDFVFAIGAEELGVPLSAGVCLLFFAFLGLSVCIARKSEDRLGRFIATGMGFIVTFQAFFNLGVVCGCMPTKGMALPFFSYGGTNMISTFIAVGTIFSVGIHSGQDKKRQLAAKVVMRSVR